MSAVNCGNWSADVRAIGPSRSLNGSLQRVWDQFASGRRADERNLLVENYTSMVVHRSRQINLIGSGLTAADLVQEGVMRLMECVSSYDHTKGAAFTTYAYRPILNAMQRAVTRGRFGPNDYRTPNPGVQLWFVSNPAAMAEGGNEENET